MAGPEFRLCKHAVAGDKLDVLRQQIGLHSLGSGGQVAQTSSCGLLLPFLGIAVAIEDNAPVVRQGLANQLLQGCFKILGLFQLIGKAAQLFGHNGIQSDIGTGDGLGGAQHTQLELVAGEGQGAGTVAIRGVLGNGGHHVHANAQQALFRLRIVGPIDDGLDHGIQLIAQEDGNDGRRRFVGAQAGIVAGRGHCAAQKLLIFINALDKGCQENQELSILPWGFSGAEQIFAGIRGKGPVVVLAAAVDPGKGLFVEQAHQIVLGSALFHGAHNKLVVIAGLVCIRVDRGKLMLAGCALVVLCFGENAQPPQLLIQILHEFGYPGTDGGEIVVVQLLSLGRGCAEKSSACQAQILPLGVQVLGQKEILLLSAHTGDDPVGFRVAKKPQNADGFPGNLLQ